jgi:hypothetical protein
MGHNVSPTGFSLQDAIPELVRSLALLLVGYFLLRWLYFKPLEDELADAGAEHGT